eukprot:TRINITY_DN14526_c0_g1_i1.p1 TRINITY_DN14526_c0_g1~~TRINITY_DN14526_c0_g1_i1.p1  ORF type:complete len:162 (-),score=19.54 TRINITY_DN14526_c0_g1_i1:37-522(-)
MGNKAAVINEDPEPKLLGRGFLWKINVPNSTSVGYAAINEDGWLTMTEDGALADRFNLEATEDGHAKYVTLNTGKWVNYYLSYNKNGYIGVWRSWEQAAYWDLAMEDDGYKLQAQLGDLKGKNASLEHDTNYLILGVGDSQPNFAIELDGEEPVELVVREQ